MKHPLMGRTRRIGFALLIAFSLAITPAEPCAAVAKLQRDPAHACCPHKAKPAIPDLTSPDCHCTISQSTPPGALASERETSVPVATISETPITARADTDAQQPTLLQIRPLHFRHVAFQQLLIY